MGLGVLETATPVVKGTVQLFDDISDTENVLLTAHLKHSKDGKVLLNPQPSDSPRDPLNRPLWKRDLTLGLVLIDTILSGVHGPILSPVTVQLAAEYGKTISDISRLSSYMTLSIGLFAIAFSVIVSVFGKRGVVVIGAALLVASDAWAAEAKGYNSLLGARILSGVGQAVFEAISVTIVADIYFVHERGARIGVFIYSLQAGVFLGVPIATGIFQTAGLRWAFGGLAIAEAIMLVLLFFFFEETAYKREYVDVLAHQSEGAIAEIEGGKGSRRHLERINTVTLEADAKPGSRWTHFNIYQGTFNRQSPFKLTVRVLALIIHPTILWAALTGLPASWLVGLSYTINTLLVAPPWNLSVIAIGNMYIAGWLGCTFGLIFAMGNDWLAKRAARRNGNIYEPEFRLFLVAPSAVFVAIGLALWGWGGGEVLGCGRVGWPAMAFFFALAACGAVLINSALISYLIDGYRQFAIESQVILFVFKNILPFAMGYFFVDWWAMDGNQTVWITMAGISLAVAVPGIVFYVFGKKLRAFWQKHPFLGLTEDRQ